MKEIILSFVLATMVGINVGIGTLDANLGVAAFCFCILVITGERSEV